MDDTAKVWLIWALLHYVQELFVGVMGFIIMGWSGPLMFIAAYNLVYVGLDKLHSIIRGTPTVWKLFNED